jgi:hypothetical protein
LQPTCASLGPQGAIEGLFGKDSHALDFTTTVLRTILEEQDIEQLGRYLASEEMHTRVIEFFSLSKRDEDCLVRHFEAEEMKKFVDDYLKSKKNFRKSNLLLDVSHQMENDAPETSVITYIKSAVKDAGLTEAETVPIIWQSITGIVDLMDARPDQIESQVVRAISRWVKVLETFCTSPRTEMILLQKVQLTCYEDDKLNKYFFFKMIQILYRHDVLSANAILYRNDKAHLAQGKTLFLKQVEGFVTWLKGNDESSSEEDDY